MERSHSCDQISVKNNDETVVLAGWLQSKREVSRKLAFLTLRDATGSIQVVARRGGSEIASEGDPMRQALEAPMESVVYVKGRVKSRATVDGKGGSGSSSPAQVEILLEDFRLVSAVEEPLPFYPGDSFNLANEDLRARYRYLDLRRASLSSNIRRRSEVTHIVRNRLVDRGFVEVETPLLLKSSPEGAREYLVPTRLASSNATIPHFYALSQSPQQPKQLLVASGGVDKYFQFARCFRDEDGRKDRQPEFTQIDLEMAFVSQQGAGEWRIGGIEIRKEIEGIIRAIWRRVRDIELPESFQVMTYQEAMNRFGSDKPDTRFGLEIQQLGLPGDQVLDFIAISGAERSLGSHALLQSATEVPVEANTSRIVITEQSASSWAQECAPGAGLAINATAPSLAPGTIVLASPRSAFVNGGSTALGRARLRIAEYAQEKCGLQLEGDNFLWVTEFPLFTHDDDKEFMAKGRWSSSHHPFTAPMLQDMALLREGNFEKIRGQHYDLVLNGVEIAGGSVRIHDSKLQEHILRSVLQLSEQEVSTFEHLLHALKCGAAPHGGIAIGFDRLMSILCGAKSIRDVIAFPKTAGGTDPVFKSPSPISDELLHTYGLASLKVGKTGH